MLHSAFLLIFLLVATPLAGFIPLAALAGVLVMVAWNMIEKHAFMVLLRASRADALVLLTTFLLTVFRDLTEAIVVGVALGSVLFIRRMSQATSIETQTPFIAEDRADTANGARKPYDEDAASASDYVIYRITGAFFFGAAASIGSVLDRIADRHKALIIDFTAVPFIDSTAAHFIYELARKTSGRDVALVLTGVQGEVKKELIAHEVRPPLATYEVDIPAGVESVERLLRRESSVSSL
jgi:SulP family sulfate permease